MICRYMYEYEYEYALHGHVTWNDAMECQLPPMPEVPVAKHVGPGRQRLPTWLRRWQAACTLLVEQDITFIDEDGETIRVTPSRLTTGSKHNFWIDQAFSSVTMHQLRTSCDAEGILSLLDAQGWVREQKP